MKNKKQIARQFENHGFNLTQERSDFLLPQIVDFTLKHKWINLHPEYQRRQVWNKTKKSQFIESLLLNVPIPPVFLYENELSRYEVMDGQQRLSTVIDFYNDKIRLSSLDKLSMLNGTVYSEFPESIKRSLDRRRISATVLVAENLSLNKEGRDIRKLVFERLNTGGVQLNDQEIRNCVYDSDFNKLLMKVTADPMFTQVWKIPKHKPSYLIDEIPEALRLSRRFSRMEDCEIALRYFAFRDAKNIKGGVKKILDHYMEKMMAANGEEIYRLEEDFLCSLELSLAIFGDTAFTHENEQGSPILSKTLFDAVMVAADKFWEYYDALVKNKNKIVSGLRKELEKPASYEVLVGKPNTAKAIKERQDILKRIFKKYSK